MRDRFDETWTTTSSQIEQDRIEMILFIGCPKIVEGMIGPIEILLANDTYD
jgi:hypothetical protein